MSNWKQVRELVQFSIKGITPKYVEKSTIMVLNQKCVRNNKIDFSLAQYTDDSKGVSENKIIRIGDILINSTGQGTAGRCAFVDKIPDGIILIPDSHILILRCKNYNEARCLNYNLFYSESFIQSFMDGSTGQGELDKIRLFNLSVPIPSNELTQQKIASVLSSLDAKIELNNRINIELEAMAKTLYDYWFVQFDFPDAEGKPYKSSGGEMVWSEELKREIPLGWEVVLMADWIEKDKSGDWGKDSLEGNYTEKVSCIRGADINGLNGLGSLNPPTRFILEKNAHKILNSHDLVIEISGGSPTQSTARLAYITEATLKRFENPLICSNFCKAISLKDTNLLYNFVYYWNSLYDSGTFFGYEGKTSGIKNFLFDSFVKSYHTVQPDSFVVEQFYNIVENIQVKKQTALAENQQLSALRDWLLPMLMNGQVVVA